MSEGIAFGRTRIRIQETDSVTVEVRDDVHAYANFFIKQSRPYFPDTKLPTYIDFPCFVLLECLVFGVSTLGHLGITSLTPKPGIPLSFFIVSAIFFLIYCQHEWVNQKSLPVVLKQPVIESQPNQNWFYEVAITELTGVVLKNYRAGVGFVQLTQGIIKIQAFNKIAVKNMTCAKWLSRLMMFLFFSLSVYNIYFMVAAFSK